MNLHSGMEAPDALSAIWILICDRLQLDGTAFVPSHYHLATQARGWLHFLDPQHEALFRRLSELFEGIDLPSATGHVHREEVRTLIDGKALTWPRMPMVLPVSERLKERIDSEQYREDVETAYAEIELEIRGPATRI